MLSPKTLIATCFTFLQVSPILIQSFLLSINPDKFSFCRVNLIGNPLPKTFSTGSIPEKERNEMLNAIEVENYQAFRNKTFFNWVISDTADPVNSDDEMLDIDYKWKIVNSFSSCHIVLTETAMIGWSKTFLKHEYLFYDMWSTFLSIATFGYLPKSGNPETTLILAITQNRFLGVSLPQYRSHLCTAPFPTFLIFCNVESLEPVGIYWVCVNCQIDRILFLNSHPIAVKSLLYHWFTKRATPLHWWQNLAVPIYRIRYTKYPYLSNVLCFYEKSNIVKPSLKKRFSAVKSLDDTMNEICSNPISVIAAVFSKVMNVSIRIGNYIENTKEILAHSKGILSTDSAQEHISYLRLHEISTMLLYDLKSQIFAYEPTLTKFQIQDTLVILSKAFRLDLWICVGVTSVLLLFYLKLHMKPWRNCIFEIISVVLQQAPSRSIGNPLLYFAFIVLSAFLAFHYSWEMAAEMISPPIPLSHSTLTELFQNGLKLFPIRFKVSSNDVPVLREMYREYVDQQ